MLLRYCSSQTINDFSSRKSGKSSTKTFWVVKCIYIYIQFLYSFYIYIQFEDYPKSNYSRNFGIQNTTRNFKFCYFWLYFVYQNFQNSYFRISLRTILFEAIYGEWILDCIYMFLSFIETQDIQGNEFVFFVVSLKK